MSGAEAALEGAILSLLASDAGVRGALGDPLRVAAPGGARPAFPYLQVVRHVSEPRDAAESETSEHRLDLQIISRAGGEDAARAALAAARAALRDAEPTLTGWRCILLAPAFSDLMWIANNNIFRGLLRVRAIVEAA